MVEINKGILRPDPPLKFLARHDNGSAQDTEVAESTSRVVSEPAFLGRGLVAVAEEAMTMENVVATDPTKVNLIASDTDLTLRGVNLNIFPAAGPRMVVNGAPTQAVSPARVLDCSRAFVPFPSNLNPNGTTWPQ